MRSVAVVYVFEDVGVVTAREDKSYLLYNYQR